MKERIRVENVSKKFKIGFKKSESALSRIVSLFSGREPRKTLEAVKDVSLKVNQKEIVGIIGKNGSGKSTLLRTIAGIYRQDSGKIEVNGKVVPVISLDRSLHGRLTMKENIFLIGSLFGLSNRKIKERLDEIIAFSDLKDFADTKVYQFSEGMKMRLVFSIAVYSSADILLLDEVFEVGDENFRKKSANKIKELIKNGASAVLVSHNLDLIKKYCDRALWMDNGIVKKEGTAAEIIKEYVK